MGGLMWIHSSYANYGLCESSYGSDLTAGTDPLVTFDTYAKDVFSADWEYTGTPGSGDYDGQVVYQYSETYLQKLSMRSTTPKDKPAVAPCADFARRDASVYCTRGKNKKN